MLLLTISSVFALSPVVGLSGGGVDDIGKQQDKNKEDNVRNRNSRHCGMKNMWLELGGIWLERGDIRLGRRDVRLEGVYGWREARYGWRVVVVDHWW